MEMVNAVAINAQAYGLLTQLDPSIVDAADSNLLNKSGWDELFDTIQHNAHLTPEEFEFLTTNPLNADLSQLDPETAREFQARVDGIYDKITESPLYQMHSGLIKTINKIASLGKKILKAMNENGHETPEESKKFFDQFDKMLAVLDVIQPITLGFDAYAFYKQLLKAKLPWDYVKVGASGSKLMANALKVPETISSLFQQFNPDNIPDIKTSKALFGLHVFSQAFSVIAGTLSVAKQWGEAKKTIDYVDAAFNTLGLVGNFLDIPASIVKKIVLFNPALEAVSQISTWAPGLGVASAVLSATSIAAAGCSMARSIKFKNRLERAVQEAAIKSLSLSQEHSLREGPVGEKFQKAVIVMEHHEAAIMLKKMIADLGKGDAPEALEETYNTFMQDLALMKEAGSCSREIASLMQQQSLLRNAQMFADHPSYRAGLRTVLEEELKRVREVKHSYDFGALMRDVQVEINKLGAPLLEQLEKVGNEAYLGKILEAHDKALEYNFNVSGSELKESVQKILQISKSSLGSEVLGSVNEAVSCLKDRAVQKISGDGWTLATSIISLVATIILAVLAFGLSCTPLAPFAYALLVAVAIASVSKIIYDHVQKNKFKERFSGVENGIYDLIEKASRQNLEREQKARHAKQLAESIEESSQAAKEIFQNKLQAMRETACAA